VNQPLGGVVANAKRVALARPRNSDLAAARRSVEWISTTAIGERGDPARPRAGEQGRD